jgi:hypothetical protein
VSLIYTTCNYLNCLCNENSHHSFMIALYYCRKLQFLQNDQIILETLLVFFVHEICKLFHSDVTLHNDFLTSHCIMTFFYYSNKFTWCFHKQNITQLSLIYWDRGKQCVLWTRDRRCCPRRSRGQQRRSRGHKTHCFPEVSVNKCFII